MGGVIPRPILYKEGNIVAEMNNAVCSICGKDYHRCLSCRDSMQLHPYRMFTDTAEHYKVFQAVRGYHTGVYNRDEFKSKLQNVDLSDLETFKESVKMLIKEALKEEPVSQALAEEVAVEEKPVVRASASRRRSYKVNNEVKAE